MKGHKQLVIQHAGISADEEGKKKKKKAYLIAFCKMSLSKSQICKPQSRSWEEPRARVNSARGPGGHLAQLPVLREHENQ